MKSKSKQIKSLIAELLPILDLDEKMELIGFLEGVKFYHSLKNQQNAQ